VTLIVAINVFASATAVVRPAAAEEDKPVIYLTFDDGPGAQTQQFLDLLASYDIEATFFVTGRVADTNPYLVQVAASAGHAIANHTYTHRSLTRLSDQTIIDEFVQTSDALEQIVGRRPNCYRPPYGATSFRVHNIAVSLGLTNIGWTAAGNHSGLWDVDTNDWRLARRSLGWSESAMMRRLNAAEGGDVVLMHDGPSNRQRGLSVLGQWLEVNHDKFDFKPLPGCGARLIEPHLDANAPELWHRFKIARLYQAHFNRPPDPEGWEYWSRQYAEGTTLEEISYAFSTSPEFLAAGSLPDDEFIDFIYNAVLNRNPDASGHQYWLSQMQNGLDRGTLVVQFSESQENIAHTVETITTGCYLGDVPTSYLCLSANLPIYSWER